MATKNCITADLLVAASKTRDQTVLKLRPHLGNIVWSNCNTVIIAACAFVTSVVFVRFGRKELYGQYISILALVHLFSVLSVPGTRTVIFKAVAQSCDGVYRTATHFSFGWSLLAVPILVTTGIILYHVKTPAIGVGVIISGLFFPFVTSLGNWMFLLKGKEEFSKLALCNLVRFGASLLAVGVSILLTGNLLVILLAYYVVHSAFNVLFYFRCCALIRNVKVDPAWRCQSYALTVMELSSVVFGQIDILLIAALLPMDQVAIYGLVMRLVGVFLTITKSTVEGIVPGLFRSQTITIKRFYQFFLLSILAATVVAWFIRYPIIWIYGSSYSELIPYTQVYMFAVPIYFLFAIVSHFMIKYQMNREINYSTALGIVVVIILYITLIPIYGIWGGIISSIFFFVTQAIAGLVFLWIRRRPTAKVGFREFATIALQIDYSGGNCSVPEVDR